MPHAERHLHGAARQVSTQSRHNYNSHRIVSQRLFVDKSLMDVRLIKASVRALGALFAASFGTLQLKITGCELASGSSWAASICHARPILWLACFVGLLSFTLVLLSRRYAIVRRPIAAALLAAYSIYGFDYAFEYKSWWLTLVPSAFMAAAVGVALRTRWGTWMTYITTTLFLGNWLWAIIAAARIGTFESVPPLQTALMFVPGVAYALLAGYCCYACAPRDGMSAGRSEKVEIDADAMAESELRQEQ